MIAALDPDGRVCAAGMFDDVVHALLWSAQTPVTKRSEQLRLGDRFRERLRRGSCCLSSTDSAATGTRAAGTGRAGYVSAVDAETRRPDRAPPILTRSRIPRTALTNLQFAMHKCRGYMVPVRFVSGSPALLDSIGYTDALTRTPAGEQRIMHLTDPTEAVIKQGVYLHNLSRKRLAHR